MLQSLLIHEKGRVTRAIYNLKRSIKTLEAISPRTPKIEAALKESKKLESQLLDASEDPAFIRNLVENLLMENKTKADSFTNTQSKRASKQRTSGSMTPKERVVRNNSIRADYAKSTLKLNAFALHHAKKGTYEKGNGKKLSKSGIKKVIYNK